MRKTLLITTLAFLLSTCSICVNAQSIYDNMPTEEFKINDSTVAMLQINPELIYETYSDVIDIQEVSLTDSQISKCVEAYEYNENGVRQELECEVTLNKILLQNNADILNSTGQDTSTLYVLMATSTSKTSDDSLTSDGVTLYGCIGWEDKLGIVNYFEYASGSRSGSYTGDGYYQAMRGTGTLCNGYFDTSFYSTSELDDTGGTEFRLIVRSSTSSGTSVQLNFTTSIFD